MRTIVLYNNRFTDYDNVEKFHAVHVFYETRIKVNRKVQRVPQSQAAANPDTKRKRKRTKTNGCKINKQMYENIDQLSLPQAS